MAAFFIAAIALSTLSVPCASVPAAIPTMRREPKSEVSFGAGGSLTQVKAHDHTQPKNKGDDEIDKEDKEEVDSNEDSAIDFCDYDFPLGTILTNNCTDDRHERILDMGECRQAAVQANAKTTGDFELGYDWYDKHPEGCFTEKCNDADGDDAAPCYFYNPSPTLPSNIVKGTPVCKRPKLQNGTADTNGGCPKDYHPVTNEARCMEFATCLTHCVGQPEFRINVANASLYNQYPKYCFIHPDDGCVYFNEPRAGMPDPTAPVGMPICNVTTITHFPPTVA